MNTFGRVFLTVVCAALVTFAATDARASIRIDYSTDGTLFTTLVSGPGLDKVSHSIGSEGAAPWWIQTIEASGFDGSPSSNLAQVSGRLQNNTGSLQSIWFRVIADGYNFPTLSPPDILLTSSIVGTVPASVRPGFTAVEYQTWIDPTNTFNDDSLIGTGAITSGLISQNIDATVSGGSWDKMQTSVVGALTHSPYTMTQLVKLTVDHGETVSFQTSQAVSPVPEPGSLALWSVLGFAAAAGAAVRQRRRRSRWSRENRLAIQGIIERK